MGEMVALGSTSYSALTERQRYHTNGINLCLMDC